MAKYVFGEIGKCLVSCYLHFAKILLRNCYFIWHSQQRGQSKWE